jgi:hypothetical protein
VYQLKKREKNDVRATTTAIDTTGVLNLPHVKRK